jgi:hypothetical protein
MNDAKLSKNSSSNSRFKHLSLMAIVSVIKGLHPLRFKIIQKDLILEAGKDSFPSIKISL